MSTTYNGLTLFASTIAAISFYKVLAGYSKKRVQRKIRISKIVVYPIKSCEGIELDSATVTKTGFKYDRAFLLIDENDLFLTQRKIPKMSLIRPSFDNDHLVVNAPGMDPLRIPLQRRSSGNNKELITVKVWSSTCQTEPISEEINQWFSKYLERPNVRLVRMKENFIRPTEVEYAPLGQTLFSDGYPFLLTNERSLDEVNLRLKEKILMNRFRPNIVIRGAEAFAEDQWKVIHIVKAANPDKKNSYLKVNVAKPCARCIMPNVIQEEGVIEKDLPVSAALSQFRKGEDMNLPNPKWKKDVFFGQNLDHESSEGFIISVEDEIEVIA